MFIESVAALKELLLAMVGPDLVWLGRFLGSLVDFFTGPITGLRTRYHWLDVGLTLAFITVIFAWHRHRKGAGPLRALRAFWRFLFPMHLYKTRSSWVDFQLLVANHFFANSFMITWRLSAGFMTAGLLAAMVWAFGPQLKLVPWTTPMVVLVTCLVFVMEEFGYYLFHLASHKIPALWAFHKVHHSAEVLTPLTVGRIHPIEYAVMAPMKAAMTALVLAPILYITDGGFTAMEIAGLNLAAAVLFGTGRMLLHSHIWVSFGPRVEHFLISPAQHQVHHSIDPRHWDKNFAGNFAFFDWMFGTLYVTHGRERLTYGLGPTTPQPHTGIISAYFLPFWQAVPGYRAIEAWLARHIAWLPARWRAAAPTPADGAQA